MPYTMRILILLTVILSLNQPAGRIRDVRGLLTSAQEFHTPTGAATQTIWTSYSYDPLVKLPKRSGRWLAPPGRRPTPRNTSTTPSAGSRP